MINNALLGRLDYVAKIREFPIVAQPNVGWVDKPIREPML